MYPQQIREYDRDAPDQETTERATFGLGCFWGPDARFGALDGVVRTRVGYAGGTEDDPSYHALGDHTEVVQVDYDPDVLDYEDLLAVAFEEHDPRHQPAKRQYQHLVLYESAEQRDAIDRFVSELDVDGDDLATRVEPLDAFHVAEDYHQKYSLRSAPALLEPLEELGYDDAAIRESPAAAKLNARAASHELPERSALGPIERPSGR